MTPAVRTKFQVVALLVREERARVQADETGSDSHRAEQLKRLDGIATILAKTAARDTSLLALLAEDAVVSDAARSLKRDMLQAAGVEPAPEEVAAGRARGRSRRRRAPGRAAVGRLPAAGQPVPRPRLLGRPRRPRPRPRRLAGWELLGPLLRSFERAGGGASACMALPEPSSLRAPGGLELMPHQAQVVAAAAAGHRTFLLADEPGLGKTAQALLAARGGERLPAARGRAERRQDQLGPRGRPLDARTARPP